MTLHVINPLTDKRWTDLIARHPRASVFHQPGWLQSLAATYGYQPLALTSAPPGESLNDGIALCRVSSWITGTRLVSLPFADHCEPLLHFTSNFQDFAGWLRAERDREGWKYVELRPRSSHEDWSRQLPSGQSFYFHTLDLTPPVESLFRAFHKDSIQRRIRRAEKAGVVGAAGRSPELAEEFYGLLLKTRRRHQLFPQPRAWFRNLLKYLRENIEIRVARKDGIPVAAILVLRHQSSVVYKYGCSDEKFHSLGAMPFLFWKLIEESKAAGAVELDFGRSDLDNPGLSTFKERFGAIRSELTYLRYPQAHGATMTSGLGARVARKMLFALPRAVLPATGSLLYRHIG